MFNKIYIAFLLFVFLSGKINAQDKYTDSLLVEYNKGKEDTVKIIALKLLISHSYDADRNIEAKKYCLKLINEFGEKYPKAAIDGKNKLIFYYYKTEDLEIADSLCRLVIAESKKLKYYNGCAVAKRNSGIIYMAKSDYKNATESYLEALKYYEKINHKVGEKLIYSDLAANFYYQSNYERAAYYWELSLKEEDKNSFSYINTCMNLANAYIEFKNYSKAEEYLKKAESFYRKDTLTESYANALGGLGLLESNRNRNKQALFYFLREADILKVISPNSTNLARAYLNLGALFDDMDQKEKSIQYVLSGYETAKKTGNKIVLLQAYTNLSATYAELNNYEKAYEFGVMRNNLQDSLNNTENQKQVNELDKKYQTEKKDKENQLLSKQVEIHQIQGRQQKIILVVAIVIILMAIGFAMVLYRQSKQRMRANLKLEAKNRIIEEQHKDITDSIKYAQRIQQAILPPDKMWLGLLPDSFVLFRPKDVLSGDFYWVEKYNNTIYVAAADCTGHGVPGALMSIVNFNLLNKAVLEQGIEKPADILDAVNQWLTQALHQTYHESAVRDGMDVALCAFKPGSKMMEFAGAFNGGYLFKKTGDIVDFSGDKMPVGVFMEDKMQSFSNKEIAVEKGDKVYIFSDGYADQFGGPKGKKLKYKQLQQYLRESLHLSMEEQKKHMEQKFLEWKANMEQVDDVLLIGITIT